MKTRSEILLLLSLIAAFCAMLFLGCASIPVTQAEKKTDEIINGDILKPDHVVTVQDKEKIKNVLILDKKVIQQEHSTAIIAEKKAESNQLWANRGKFIFGAGIFIGILAIISGIVSILRRFHIIP